MSLECFLMNPSLVGARPTAENLVPIRLDIQFEGQRYKDAFTWNPSGFSRKNLTFLFSIFSSLQYKRFVVCDSLILVFLFWIKTRIMKSLSLPKGLLKT